MNTFCDKNVWILGASSGIGEALAIKLSAKGANLILSSRSYKKLKLVNEKIKGSHEISVLDVRNEKLLERTAIKIKKKYGSIDSVIFMAANYVPSTIEQLKIRDVRKIVDTNLLGVFNTIKAILPIMKQQEMGQIAICASLAGYRGLPRGQPYSSTKAAIINLVETLKIEQKDLDIKLINPGFVRTELTKKNKFKMPMIIEPERAAQIIAKGLLSGVFEIHFPITFSFFMKLIRILPSSIYFAISSHIKM